MLSFIRGEFATLRPLILALTAAALAFGVAAVYRSGYEAGMLEAFHNDNAVVQAEVNERVREMEAGRDPSAGMSSQPSSNPDNASQGNSACHGH